MNDNEFKNRQREEAVARMKLLKLHSNVIGEFKTGKLNLSDRAILYWVEDEEMKTVISEFEEKYNAVVYHCIVNNTEFGKLLSLLYVSAHEEEWELDRFDLLKKFPYAYVANLDDDLCSEIGRIGIQPAWGGVLRTE